MDKQSRLNTTDLIEMSGLFPTSLIKRQVLILVDSLDPTRGGGDKCARQTNLRLATAANTAIPAGLNLLIKLDFLLLTLVRFFRKSAAINAQNHPSA